MEATMAIHLSFVCVRRPISLYCSALRLGCQLRLRHVKSKAAVCFSFVCAWESILLCCRALLRKIIMSPVGVQSREAFVLAIAFGHVYMHDALIWFGPVRSRHIFF